MLSICFIVNVDCYPVADIIDLILWEPKLHQKRTGDLRGASSVFFPTVLTEFLTVRDVMQQAGNHHPGFVKAFLLCDLASDVCDPISVLQAIGFCFRVCGEIVAAINFRFKNSSVCLTIFMFNIFRFSLTVVRQLCFSLQEHISSLLSYAIPISYLLDPLDAYRMPSEARQILIQDTQIY